MFTLSYAKNTAYLWRLETVDSAVITTTQLHGVHVYQNDLIGQSR